MNFIDAIEPYINAPTLDGLKIGLDDLYTKLQPWLSTLKLLYPDQQEYDYHIAEMANLFSRYFLHSRDIIPPMKVLAYCDLYRNTCAYEYHKPTLRKNYFMVEFTPETVTRLTICALARRIVNDMYDSMYIKSANHITKSASHRTEEKIMDTCANDRQQRITTYKPIQVPRKPIYVPRILLPYQT